MANRVRTSITREALAQLLGYTPADKVVVTGVEFNQDYKIAYVYLEGEAFPEVAEGMNCPDFSRPAGFASPNAVTVKSLTQPNDQHICPQCHKAWVEENYE